MTDLISRQEAINKVEMLAKKYFDHPVILRSVRDMIEQLPSAQSEIIRCKDCRYWREHKYAKETKRYIPFCGFNAIYTEADDYCSKAERRKDG